MLHNISAVDDMSEEGHPFFCVKLDDGKDQVVTTRNIVKLEKNKDTPISVTEAIDGIWKTLSIENCHITADVLRLVFDYENVLKEEETFSHLISQKCGNDADKSAPITMELACQSLLPCKTNDLLEHFVKSKLGVLLLRDMVNVSQYRHRRPLPLACSVLKALDRQYIESPYSCCYVTGINLEVIDTNKTGKYVRSKPKFVYGKNELLQTANADIPTQKQFDEANVKGSDTFYTYGQILSCRLGHMGDYADSEEEFQRKKQSIEQRWSERESYATLAGQTFSKPKWYDSYAGTRELTQAKYKLVLSDAPSLSVFSTLSAMKRNVITFLYMAMVFREFSCDHGDTISKEDLKWMGQKFSRYFINDETLQKSYKAPIRIPHSKRSTYMKIDDLVFHMRNGPVLRMDERKKLLEKGVTEELVGRAENLQNKVYKHVDILNIYSKLPLTEKERQSLSGDGEERDSLVVVPFTLGSYQEMSVCKSTIKFIGGIKERINYYEMPVWVAKSSLLYERSTKEASRILSSGKRLHQDEAVADAKEMVYTLLSNGYLLDEACNMLSLSDKAKEELRCETEGEPPQKKKRC